MQKRKRKRRKWNYKVEIGFNRNPFISLSSGTVFDMVSSRTTSLDSLLRASTCFCWRINVSRRYSWYDSPIQRRRDLQKSGLIPASSSSSRAHTLPEWDENLLILSSDKSGWTFLAKVQSTSEILFPIRYFVLPFLSTKTAMGCLSVWLSLLDRRKILYAAWTGYISGWLLSDINVIDWPFCLFFWIQKLFSFSLGKGTPHLKGGLWWPYHFHRKKSNLLAERL